jgi:hypothetical protein
MAALEDLPRPGKQPTITAEAKAWVVNLACRKGMGMDKCLASCRIAGALLHWMTVITVFG